MYNVLSTAPIDPHTPPSMYNRRVTVLASGGRVSEAMCSIEGEATNVHGSKAMAWYARAHGPLPLVKTSRHRTNAPSATGNRAVNSYTVSHHDRELGWMVG